MNNQLNLFCRDWLNKAAQYNDDELASYFDRFTSLYVIYNALYMDVMLELYKLGVDIAKDFKDKKAATDYVIQYLKAKSIMASLLDDEESVSSWDSICQIIQEEKFHIVLDWGEHNRAEDLKLFAMLKSNSSAEKAKAILSVFYHIRCNLFHGHKGFNSEQKSLLKPVNHLLNKTIIILFERLNS